MFNILKRNKQGKQNPTRATAATEDPVLLVERIHADFDSASERLLNTANAILSKEIDKEAEDYKKLAGIGFVSLKKSIEIKAIEEEKNLAKITSTSIAKYQKYSYKYITKEETLIICKKYGLLLGSIATYIGDIPKKNRDEIINFSIDPNDRPIGCWLRNEYWYEYSYESFDSILRKKERESPSIYSGENGAKQLAAELNSGGLFHDSEMAFFKPFEIVAPFKDFNLKDHYIKDNQIKKIHIPDPVVLCPVKGDPEGYLIVSKWGAEAEIKEFQ